MSPKPRWRIVLLRRNGRYVREWIVPSKYAAKRRVDRLEDKYDDGFRLEIRDPNGKTLLNEEDGSGSVPCPEAQS